MNRKNALAAALTLVFFLGIMSPEAGSAEEQRPVSGISVQLEQKTNAPASGLENEEDDPETDGDWEDEDDPEADGDWEDEDDPEDDGDWENEDDPEDDGDWEDEDDPENDEDWEDEDDPEDDGDWEDEDDPEDGEDPEDWDEEAWDEFIPWGEWATATDLLPDLSRNTAMEDQRIEAFSTEKGVVDTRETEIQYDDPLFRVKIPGETDPEKRLAIFRAGDAFQAVFRVTVLPEPVPVFFLKLTYDDQVFEILPEETGTMTGKILGPCRLAEIPEETEIRISFRILPEAKGGTFNITATAVEAENREKAAEGPELKLIAAEAISEQR